jgi:hypothetical protein
MQVINGTDLSMLVDYSFGDHLGGREPHILEGGHSRDANGWNGEFISKCKEFEGKLMTLFIDNIRLYNRTIEVDKQDADYVQYLMAGNDLLKLCSMLPKNKFIIFCSHEDTPIDDQIKIPENVLAIYAVNAGYFGGKIHPFPYGIQRTINRPEGPKDHRQAILKAEIDKPYTPTKLLYINCGIGRNKDREPLVGFEGLDWTTCRFNKDSMFFTYDRYLDFLNEMRDHKFMVCPEGHGMDCHRNWELLYMRRVPVMKRTPYFTCLMSEFPVLFIDDWSDITKELLEKNDHLFQEAQTLDLDKLDLNKIFKNIIKQYEK